MDNASKALLIASEVLIGVLVISLGLYFLKSLSDFGNSTVFNSKEMEEIQKYNEPFLKLINAKNSNISTEKDKEHYLNAPNIGDVVTVMNYARDINLKNSDNIDEETVTMKVNNKKLKEYYLDKKGFYGKFNENMYELLEKFSVKIQTEDTERSKQDLTIKPLEISVDNIKKDQDGKIINMDIMVALPQY